MIRLLIFILFFSRKFSLKSKILRKFELTADFTCLSATPNKATAPFNASTEYYTTIGGPTGPTGPITTPVTPPLMAYPPGVNPQTNGYGGPQRGALYAQPVTTSPNYHPYRRQLQNKFFFFIVKFLGAFINDIIQNFCLKCMFLAIFQSLDKNFEF